ncbi:hypothetical protein O164_19575 [Pseudomonas taiwanensis SJ9]|uniref:Uncharacterized protein n=1 Tax=Pseudomonas taiwanensis SJ9 TaxID=1388762 RepID=V7D9H3_9PSED|nr:hypothetical protein O164_19575 [Pseudomonas taiwanensis SJ9]
MVVVAAVAVTVVVAEAAAVVVAMAAEVGMSWPVCSGRTVPSDKV